MCNVWTCYCDCCNDFQYLHTFRHCSKEQCVTAKHTVVPKSYCDLCIQNGCKDFKGKCVEEELDLRYDKMKSSEFFNLHRGRNIRKR